MNNISSRSEGHVILIFGYVIIDTQIWLLIKNPGPINEGRTEMISYEKLCNGNDYIQNEKQDNWIWESSIVINTSYANNTIPYYFNQ